MGSRVKNFVATGVAPDGRLYAGDLNAMQDDYADLMNLTQTIGVGTVQVGESGLMIYRYGAGEMRITGSLRMDGIFRPLGGLVPPAFTNTTRDALLAAARPYGLLILNTEKNLYEWNSGTDVAPIWSPMTNQLVGNYGSRPAASAANTGLFYHATDVGGMFYSNGSVWSLVLQRPVKILAADLGTHPGPYDGQQVLLVVDASLGKNWHMRYNSSSGSAYKWEPVGAQEPIEAYADGTVTNTASSVWQDLGGPSIVVPRGGDYRVQVSAVSDETSSSYGGLIGVNDPVVGNQTYTRVNIRGAGSVPYLSGGNMFRHNGLTAGQTIKMMYFSEAPGAPFPSWAYRRMWVYPARLS